MIVVVDSGVWISAIQFGGVPARALERLQEVDELAICIGIEQEVLRILEAKFGQAPETIRSRMASFWNNAIRAETTGRLCGISRDRKDDFVIECALNAQADILVSGDNDLLCLGTHARVQILTARQYCNLPI